MASPIDVKLILYQSAAADSASGTLHMLGAGWSISPTPTTPQAVALLIKVPWTGPTRFCTSSSSCWTPTERVSSSPDRPGHSPSWPRPISRSVGRQVWRPGPRSMPPWHSTSRRCRSRPGVTSGVPALPKKSEASPSPCGSADGCDRRVTPRPSGNQGACPPPRRPGVRPPPRPDRVVARRSAHEPDRSAADRRRRGAGPDGRAAARHPARRGRPRPVVWCSPRRRASDTARLAGLEPDAVRDDLVEWDYGTYEGRTTPDIRTEDPGWTVWTHPSPGGESGEQVAARIDHVLADVERELVTRDVVLIGHGHAGRVLIARYLGLAPRPGSGSPSTPPRSRCWATSAASRASTCSTPPAGWSSHRRRRPNGLTGTDAVRSRPTRAPGGRGGPTAPGRRPAPPGRPTRADRTAPRRRRRTPG